jgi:hypothetical protein
LILNLDDVNNNYAPGGDATTAGTTGETVGKVFSGCRVFSINTHHLSEGGA